MLSIVDTANQALNPDDLNQQTFNLINIIHMIDNDDGLLPPSIAEDPDNTLGTLEQIFQNAHLYDIVLSGLRVINEQEITLSDATIDAAQEPLAAFWDRVYPDAHHDEDDINFDDAGSNPDGDADSNFDDDRSIADTLDGADADSIHSDTSLRSRRSSLAFVDSASVASDSDHESEASNAP